jgi:hypothetical protein
MAGKSELVRVLPDRYGTTYAEEAGIRLADKPSPLYRLLVLALLLSARTCAPIAVAAAKELSTAGMRTPRAMAEASWQQRVDALGRGGYRRYDERTSTMLGEGAELLLEKYRVDLRNSASVPRARRTSRGCSRSSRESAGQDEKSAAEIRRATRADATA